jgi:3-hydroxyisobutyrate dehydrogenase-like beta-hydroxyacid dehydrogenase
MGVSIAASAKNSGHTVYWASAGRSETSQQRAAEQGLEDAGTVAALCEHCEAILSVCPPAAAESVALEGAQ